MSRGTGLHRRSRGGQAHPEPVMSAEGSENILLLPQLASFVFNCLGFWPWHLSVMLKNRTEGPVVFSDFSFSFPTPDLQPSTINNLKHSISLQKKKHI